MVNFRYHIVSLTAVFLALIIGILMGTTVVSKATVDGLKANLHRAETRSAAVHRTNDKLSGELSDRAKVDNTVDAALSDRVLANAVDRALDGVPVLIVADDSVDSDVLDAVASVLAEAGADVDGTLVTTDRMALEDTDADKLAQLLDLSPTANVRLGLARRFAAVLAQASGVPAKQIPGATTTTTTTAGGDRPPGTAPPTTRALTQPDLISTLRDNGFLDFRPVKGQSSDAKVLEAPELADGTGYRYVVVSGADAKSSHLAFLSQLTADLARIGDVPVVATTQSDDPTSPDDDEFLGPLLKRDGVKGSISTVDDVEAFQGLVAVAYALANAGDDHFGNYGVGDTATAVVPSWNR